MFSFVKNRYTFYAIALVLLVLSLASPFFTRLNLGIDMTGGIQVEYTVASGDIDAIISETRDNSIDTARASLDATGKKIITDTLVYRVSGSDNFVVEAGVNEDGVSLTEVETAKTNFVDALTI